ncbi:uncharacterized protein ACO6RY_18729 [Pungitius sinensis]
MQTNTGKERLMDGVMIGETRILARDIQTDEMVVSFLALPIYLEDKEITEKLREWGVKAVSGIRRRMWPGTDVADGTRFVKVKFTDTVKSLPYSTKFNVVGGAEHFRVIHDRQVKVCAYASSRGTW